MVRTSFLAMALLAVSPASTAGAPETGFTLVPEMERPPGILEQPESERRSFEKSDEAQRGLARLEARVRSLWPRLREIDLVELSRYQVEATRGYRLPAEPGELRGRTLAREAAAGRWHLELRGPRLPARYDIVHRYLYVFATYDPASGELGELVVTIRGWVLE